MKIKKLIRNFAPISCLRNYNILGSTGFDSKLNWNVSIPSYEINAR